MPSTRGAHVSVRSERPEPGTWVILGLRVETPFVVTLASGEVTVPVLLRDFGGLHGMLLVTDFSLISPYADELVDLGYGYSCLSESTGVADTEEEAALMEMLSDWA